MTDKQVVLKLLSIVRHYWEGLYALDRELRKREMTQADIQHFVEKHMGDIQSVLMKMGFEDILVEKN